MNWKSSTLCLIARLYSSHYLVKRSIKNKWNAVFACWCQKSNSVNMASHSMHKNMWIAEFRSLSLLCLLYLFNLCTVCILLTQLHGQNSDVVPRNVLPVKRSCSHQRSWCNVDIKEPPWIAAPVNRVSARAHVKILCNPCENCVLQPMKYPSNGNTAIYGRSTFFHDLVMCCIDLYRYRVRCSEN